MTKEQIKEMMENATKGKWYDHGGSVSTNPKYGGVGYPLSDYAICSLDDGEYILNTNKHDAAFIAALPDIAATALAHAETIRHICQTVHQAYSHEGEPATCRNGVCDNLKTL